MKLQSISLIVLGIFLLVACQKDNPTGGSVHHLESIVISEYEDFLNISNLEKGTKAIFVNKNSNEKVLNYSIQKELLQRTNNRKEYLSESIRITYEEIDRADYYIETMLCGDYMEDNATQLIWMNSGLYSTRNLEKAPIIWINFDQDAATSIFYADQMILNNEKFFQVHYIRLRDIYPNSISSFNELYFSERIGIVGFTDENNELWTLKSYE